MEGPAFVLAVGLHDDPDDALADLLDLTNPGPTAEVVAGAAVLVRRHGRTVLQQGDGGSTAFGIGSGAAAGIVVDTLLALPLVGTALGAVLGGVLGRRSAAQESRTIAGLLADDLPVDGAALVVVVPEPRAAEVRAAMRRARRTTGRLLEDPVARRAARGLVRGNPSATQWLEPP
jgi:uncharacterized membrane protein